MRPRLVWNRARIAIVGPSRGETLRWSDVACVEVRANAVLIGWRTADVQEWEFDRVRWLARWSTGYAERGERLGERLASSLDDGVAR